MRNPAKLILILDLVRLILMLFGAGYRQRKTVKERLNETERHRQTQTGTKSESETMVRSNYIN